jgi:hypothetical protein
MRLPWQRRSALRTGPDEAASPQNAWRSLTPLRGSVDPHPPMTAASAQLADGLSRRLRSTAERPPLIHRSGLPDPVAVGVVRGIAVASVAPHAMPRRRVSAVQELEEQGEASAFDASAGAPVPEPARVQVARRARSATLTAVDANLAASVREARQRQPASAGVEDLAVPEASPPEPPNEQPSAAPPGLQRTFVRRRMSPGPRPVGLQAPVAQAPHRTGDREAVQDAAPEPHSAAEQAPRSVAAAVGRLHGADVSDVRIERGEEAERLAAAARARAVTRSGEVFIPATEGRLDSGRGGGLLAHELTHVIQQRRLGSSVPLEHSPRGRRLETEAAMTERHVRGDLGAPAPPSAAAEPAAQPTQPVASMPDQDDIAAAAKAHDIMEDLVDSGRAIRMPDGALVFPGSGGHLAQQPSPVQVSAPVQRAPENPDAAATPGTEAMQPDGQPTSPPSPPLDPSSVQRITPPARLHITMPPPSVSRAPGAAPASGAPPESAAQPGGRLASAEALAATADTVAAPPQPVPVTEETTPELDFDEIARRVYGQVRTQLRTELLIDRERAGLLTDFR